MDDTRFMEFILCIVGYTIYKRFIPDQPFFFVIVQFLSILIQNRSLASPSVIDILHSGHELFLLTALTS